MALLTNKQLFAVVGTGVLGVYLARQAAGEAVSDVGDLINPTSNTNIIQRGLSGITRVLTNRETDIFGRPLTLGAWLAGG